MAENELDPTDVSILNLLQENGGLTHKELAFKTNKSLSAVQARIKKLKEAGIIRKFVALLDRQKVDKKLAAFVSIKIKDGGHATLIEFKDWIIACDEVIECYHTSGGWDFLLKIVVEDMTEYNKFILDKLSFSPHMGTVESFFVISESKYETKYKLKAKT